MKLGIVTNGILTSVDYYRTMGFWPFMVDAALLENPGWWDIPHYDIILVCRPYTIKGMRACQMAKEFGKTLWIDFDDDILSPNPNFYVTDEMIDAVKMSLPLADLIICSTKGVENAYKHFGKTVIRKNYFNDKILKFEPKFSEGNLVAYRGLIQYHKYNIAEFMNVFMLPLNWKRCGVSLPLPGKDIKEKPFMDYIINLRESRPAVLFKPLNDLKSNRAKSNCAWFEAAYSGGVCLAPDWEEWHENGILNYSDPGNAAEALIELIKNIEFRKELFNESVETIKEKYLLSTYKFVPEEWGI